MTVDSRRSPLRDWWPAFEALPANVRLAELPFAAQLNLRLDPAGPAATAVGVLLGAALPARPCSSVAAPAGRLLWLGPDEWLLLGDQPDSATADQRTAELAEALRATFGAEHGAATDVSAQRTVLRLGGSGARDLLAKGCAIDLHPRVSPVGSCLQTLLGQAGVIIVVTGPGEFLLLVRASFADYLARWLVDASADLPT